MDVKLNFKKARAIWSIRKNNDETTWDEIRIFKDSNQQLVFVVENAGIFCSVWIFQLNE